jgi:hypothetical protein
MPLGRFFRELSMAPRALHPVIGRRWRWRAPIPRPAGSSESCPKPLARFTKVHLFYFLLSRFIIDTGGELCRFGSREANLPTVNDSPLSLMGALADGTVFR